MQTKGEAMAGAATNAGVVRYGFQTTIERASSADGKYRIRGVANTFRVMRSRRLIHPDAFAKSLPKDGAVDLPLLMAHGNAAGFATIGRVTRAWVDPRRGLLFEAWVGEGTDNANEARTLIDQGLLRTVSIGWIPESVHMTYESDRDLDPVIRERMRDAGVSEAEVAYSAELVEVSLVDLPDDPGAVLSVADAAAVNSQVAELRREVAELREILELAHELGTPDGSLTLVRIGVDALQRRVEKATHEAMGDFRARVMEILCDDEVIEAARASQARTMASLQEEIASIVRGAVVPESPAGAPARASWPAGAAGEEETIEAFLKRMGETAE